MTRAWMEPSDSNRCTIFLCHVTVHPVHCELPPLPPPHHSLVPPQSPLRGERSSAARSSPFCLGEAERDRSRETDRSRDPDRERDLERDLLSRRSSSRLGDPASLLRERDRSLINVSLI